MRVYINDDFSLVGEPVKARFSYEIATPLVDGDTEESLGIELYVENIDVNKPDKYVIKARFENANYLPQCLNYDNIFAEGGTYTVYATRLSATAYDGSEFEIYISNGIRNMTLRIEKYEREAQPDGYKFVSGYEFIFENEDGERVFPNTEYAVLIKRLSVYATHYALVFASGQTGRMAQTSSELIQTTGDMRALALFIEEVAPACKSPFETAAYALAGLCGALAVVLAALIAAYLKGGRYFK